MEEITIELDDEIADWLDVTFAEQKKSASEFIGEMIRDYRENLARSNAPRRESP